MHTSTLNVILWCLVYVAGSAIFAILILGWLKGLYWESQLKLKKRQVKY